MSFVNLVKKSEKGQTALETAIILIAFVVVAAVFAFTILTAGSNKSPCSPYGKISIPEPLAGKCGYVVLGLDQTVTLKKDSGETYEIGLSRGNIGNTQVYVVTVSLPVDPQAAPNTVSPTYLYAMPTEPVTDTIPSAVGDIAIQRVTDDQKNVTVYVRFFPDYKPLPAPAT